MSPLLSVVVPIYDVESYLGECLESLLAQTLHDLEVIMVDDGSTDGSAAIAKEFAGRDDRFRLIQQENQGLGPARNTGVRYATGTYLAFVDSDDVVPPGAYERMVRSLEATGSDFACGGVRRLTSGGLVPSPMHTGIFAKAGRKTHISRRTELLGDRTAWNKVFRRSFWDATGLEFPGGLYEDAPVTIPAHVLANSVDVLSMPVYHWRAREGTDRSITQRRTEPGNLEDRVSSIRKVIEFLGQRAPQLLPDYLTRVFSDELPLYIDVADEGDRAYRESLRTFVNELSAHVDGSVFRSLSALKRLKFHLIRQGMYTELSEVLVHQQREIGLAEAVLRDGRWYIRYPYFEDPDRGIPDDIYDITDEVTLEAGADRAFWHDGRLRIEGYAYVSRIPMPDAQTGTVRLWLRDLEQGTVVELPVERTYRPCISADARQAAACYDWAGFTTEVDPAALSRRRFGFQRRFRSGDWQLEVELTMPGGLRRKGTLRGSGRADQRWPSGRDIAPAVSLRASSSRQVFGLEIRSVAARVTDARAAGHAIEVDGRVLDGRVTELVLIRPNRTAEITLPVSPRGKDGFTARISMDSLPEWEETPTQDRLPWDLFLRVSGHEGPIQLAAEDHVEVWQAKGGAEVALTRTGEGFLRLIQRGRHPVVTTARWTEEGTLRLSGHLTGDERPADLVMRLRHGHDERRIPLAWNDCEFTAEIGLTERSRFGGELPLRSGRWDLFLPLGGQEVGIFVARSACEDLPDAQVVGVHEITLTIAGLEELWLRVRPALDPTERGLYGTKRIATEDYPVYRRSPLRDLAVFESFQGRQYSDNPRAIFEEIRRRRPDFECVWVTQDGQFEVPNGVRTVLRGSRAHAEALAQARYLVANDPMPEWLAKRPGQVYLQTWHGTPLKRIAYDVERPTFRNPQDYLRRFGKDVAQWDALVSPNPFSTPIWRRAFRYDGEILEIGYPRNDLLFRPENQVARIRARLGIPQGRRVVLYAPTWRDDQAQTGGYRMDLQIDLEEARQALGEDHVLLIRSHVNVAGGLCPPGDEFARDVSRYPDIADLYLVADVLITDYSSVMFDYAATGRPILLFTYDLEHYRDELRGFYFDLEAEAPGPLCRTSSELVGALCDIEAVTRLHKHRYAAFRQKFCPWDDGLAAARAVDWLFGR